MIDKEFLHKILRAAKGVKQGDPLKDFMDEEDLVRLVLEVAEELEILGVEIDLIEKEDDGGN